MIRSSDNWFCPAGAALDIAGLYRYHLWRTWNTTLPRVLWVMLNPSRADHLVNDATVRRCLDFSQRWGYGSLEVVNLFAWRSTAPDMLLDVHVVDPVGDENDAAIMDAAQRAERVVVAWGGHRAALRRVDAVLTLLARAHRPPFCLGRTQDGQPVHPLRLPKTLEPVPYLAPRWEASP